MTKPSSEHENWIRYYCIDQSIKINRFRGVDAVIKDAARLSQFVLQKPDCQVHILKKSEEKA